MKFSIIAAVDQKRGIGILNRLPWRLKKDSKFFAEITIGKGNNAVIMGMNTWQSLPEKFRPLKDRLNVVLSKDQKIELPHGVLNYQSFDEALLDLEKKSVEEIFVIGGAMLYQTTINRPDCEKLYITEILSTFDCDTFFPEIPSDFKKTEESEMQEENGIKFRYTVYQR